MFAAGNNKRVRIAPNAQPAAFQSDPALLGRVLVNVLRNALEAVSPEDTVNATCVESDGAVRFSVHNDSVMPDHVRAHIFQRSFSTKGAGRGTCTYSIKLLAEQYPGGSARFESEPGRGTTFHVEIPCA